MPSDSANRIVSTNDDTYSIAICPYAHGVAIIICLFFI